MNKLNILIKCITLIQREREIEESASDSSKDLIKTVISLYKDTNGKSLLGGESNLVDDLKYLIIDMLNNPDNYDKTSLLESLEIILKDKPTLITVVDKTINTELTQAGLKRSVISIRNHLNNYYKEEEIKNIVSKASYKLATNRLDDESINDFTAKLITNLEALSVSTKTKDPGIVDEVDMHDVNMVSRTMDSVKQFNEDTGKLVTGWKSVNKMLNGGFRKGEQWVVSALQHNYKSGFVQSLFVQLATLNVPIMKDKSKKPLIVLFSFEDDMHIVTEFIYRYIYYNENNELPDLTKVTGAEVGEYITKKLSATGYHVKILRINPSEWSYKHMFNKILEYEASGFELHAIIIDYLSKLPTIGCVSSGPTGTDVRDLFNRVRNFCSS